MNFIGAKSIHKVLFLISLLGATACHRARKEMPMQDGSTAMPPNAGTDPSMLKDAGDPNEDLLKSYLSNEQSHPGSSKKGRVFDYGPRQFPTLPAPESILLKTPIRSCNENATESLSYGFSHLHAFQTLEAERYFRLALYQDEKCTMALWAAGLSQIIFQVGDTERGLKFAKLSLLLTQYYKIELSDLEKRLQFSLINLLESEKDNERRKTFVRNWFELIKEYPRESELKALGALFIWQYNLITDLSYSSNDIETLIQEVLAENPKHPIHHTRIHLWNDGKNEFKALGSAEKIGPSFMNAAHMWHMGSHIYSMVKKPHESNEQFIRAAYLDQTQQKELLDFPYMLHNYGHNQNYWSYNLAALGNYKKSIEIAKGLLEIPLHPKYNNPLINEGNLGIYHSPYLAGLASLVATVKNYGVHEELLNAEKEGYLPLDPKVTKDQALMLKLYYQLAWAHLKTGNSEQSKQYQILMQYLASQSPSLSSSAANYQKIIELFSQWQLGNQNVEIADALAELSEKENRVITANVLSSFYRKAKAPEKVLKLLGDLEYNTFADHSDYLEKAHAEASLGNIEAARWDFEKAAKLASQLNKNSDAYKLGEEIITLLGESIPQDWRVAYSARDLALKIPADFSGERFELAQAPSFNLKNALNAEVNLEESLAQSEKGIVLVFVLGGSCIRCNEQLYKLNQDKKRFEYLGYKIIAITTDTQEDLASALDSDGKPLTDYELLSDSKMDVFKKYRSYDDFENLPLHGTFVIAKNKAIRFLDRGALPFEDTEHLIREIKRLEKIQRL